MNKIKFAAVFVLYIICFALPVFSEDLTGLQIMEEQKKRKIEVEEDGKKAKQRTWKQQ